MAKRIILIVIIAIVVSVPVAFLMDSVFISLNTVLSGIIGFALVSVFTSFILIQHERIKSKPLTTKILIYITAMVTYIILSLIVLLAFFFFVIMIGIHRG